MKDGIIELDSKLGKELGFASDKFEGWLWKEDGHIYFSFFVSLEEGEGNLSNLFESILEHGYGIKVATPFAKIRAILKKHGFKRNWEEKFRTVEVWVKK